VDFPIPYRAIEHVRRAHGYDPRTNNSENEERRVGAVHLDGFLQPVTAKQGWLGRGVGRAKSKSVSGPTIRSRRNRAKSKMVEGEMDKTTGMDGDGQEESEEHEDGESDGEHEGLVSDEG
jgi:N-terminal acetyltransferase B complex catalytic subunit